MVTTPIENDENLSHTSSAQICHNRMEGQEPNYKEKDGLKVKFGDLPVKTVYRRSRSEDPNMLCKLSKTNLRVALKPQDPSLEEAKTPLLDSDGEIKHRNRPSYPLSSYPSISESQFYSGKHGQCDFQEFKESGRCQRPRKIYILFTLAILLLLGLTVYLLYITHQKKNTTVAVPNQAPSPVGCKVYDATLDEDVLKTVPKQKRYYLHWRSEMNTSMAHMKVSNDNVFEALEAGNFKINLKLHINTHHWIEAFQINNHFKVRLCLTSSEKKKPEHCVVKIQSSKVIDDMGIDRVVNLNRGQQIRFVLITDEEVFKLLKSSQDGINRLQIYKENC